MAATNCSSILSKCSFYALQLLHAVFNGSKYQATLIKLTQLLVHPGGQSQRDYYLPTVKCDPLIDAF